MFYWSFIGVLLELVRSWYGVCLGNWRDCWNWRDFNCILFIYRALTCGFFRILEVFNGFKGSPAKVVDYA